MLLVVSGLLVAGGRVLTAQAARNDAYPPSLYQAMHWRNIGPFRGGRVAAVAGVASEPRVYYMGSAGGGVWKTVDAGITWTNVSDGFFKTGSVGAIAVAPSDPNVVYVGMGEPAIRGVATSDGDGVYKSTDAGATWTHLGLEKTMRISSIVVDPRNAEVVYVGAQGNPWVPSPERGVYRSLDGGQTWKLVHHVSDTAGVSQLSMDPSNPRIVYAAYWDEQRFPWEMRSGGPGSGIWKTTDGGDHWTKLTKGLPTDEMGKIGVAVSPADPQRVWANIEAKDGGVYRSDDGGRTWTRTSSNRITRARSWYYTQVTADPQDPNTVYVINAPLLRSIDGGRTFQPVRQAHGDNHSLWINPHNDQNMINGNDGGAAITFDGGRTWSTEDNQPTAQFYRVNADQQFPYYLYSGQQDNTTVAIASRSFDRGIGRTDWFTYGGCESASVAFDPKDPRDIYANCYQGMLDVFDRQTHINRSIMPLPAQGLGARSNEQQYRFNWNAPVVASPENPKVIYFGGNVVFRTEDGGQTWTVISPDLTRDDKQTQGPGGGPITNEGAGGEVFNTILYIEPSPHDANTIWVGTDDGLVQLTRDGGRTWTKVTPPGITNVQINAIDVSPEHAGTAYVAATGFKWGDDAPYAFKTTDYGKTWTKIVNGFASNDIVRVVREDPERPGLLYAGTNTGVDVSFDDGAHWQSLQLNLPVVPVTDLMVHGNDLLASTQGRAFWILDDLTPLRQLTPEVAKAPAHLFRPEPALRVLDGGKGGPDAGENPPIGAIIDYELAAAPKAGAPLTMEILHDGRVVRAFSSESDVKEDVKGFEPRGGVPKPDVLPARAGMNRFVWDLRGRPLHGVPGIMPGDSLQGYALAPGAYELRLMAAGQTLTAPLTVEPDPRTGQAAAAFGPQQALLEHLRTQIDTIADAAARMRDVRTQIDGILKRTTTAKNATAIQEAGRKLGQGIDEWVTSVVQPERRTFQDVINFPPELMDQYTFLFTNIDGNNPPLTAAMTQRADALDADWAKQAATLKSLDQQVQQFNDLLKRSGVEPIIVR
ncbi:MAG: glycosyl hydrolase [Acidobacteriota bacterium]|nr:glycosyl hydrolase [Acidobacteriota bacterium]